jgi:NTE family protein
MASCAIPGWYAPVDIGGRRYIDGGAWSATSVDVLADAGLDEVYVLAPMVSFAIDNPRQVLARLERHWRTRVTKRCLREAALVQEGGTAVTVLGPGPEDLEVMGANLMAPARRSAVLETALRTCAEALRHSDPGALAEAR